MNVNVTGSYVYFTIPIFDGISITITQTTISGLIVTLLLCGCFIYFGKNLKKRPDGKQVLVEKGVKILYDMVIDTMGKHNAHYLPLIGTIFLSSICSSLIGMTGFLRSATADLSVPLVWALIVTGIIWYNNIKYNGFVGWLKGFTEPIVVMTPMNIISEIAQPVSMAFRHFGNVAGGGVITSILYTALSMASSLALNAIASSGIAVAIVLLVIGAGLIFLWTKKKKAAALVFGIIMAVLGIFGGLQALGILSGVPVFAFGIPAVLSVYFDLFSGFVQALVFSLLSMVYIAGACPPPEEAQA